MAESRMGEEESHGNLTLEMTKEVRKNVNVTLAFLCLTVEGVAAVCPGLVLGAMVVAVEGVADVGLGLVLGALV